MQAVIDTPDTLASLGFFIPGSVVLDLGCGSAPFTDLIRTFPIATYVGMDIRRTALATARHRNLPPHFLFLELSDLYNPAYNEQGRTSPASFTLPFLPDTFSSVICHSLFTHLETEGIAACYLREITKVLKPKGLLWTTWFRSPPNEVSTSALRTVYSDRFIRHILASYDIIYEKGGDSTSYHDQWELGLRLKP